MQRHPLADVVLLVLRHPEILVISVKGNGLILEPGSGIHGARKRRELLKAGHPRCRSVCQARPGLLTVLPQLPPDHLLLYGLRVAEPEDVRLVNPVDTEPC